MQEMLEGLDLGKALQQRLRIDGIPGRSEAAGFGRKAKPLPFLRDPDVSIVVACGGGIDCAESLDGLQGIRHPFHKRSVNEAGRQSAKVFLRYAMGRRLQRWIPGRRASQRIDLSSQVAVRPNGLGKCDCANDLADGWRCYSRPPVNRRGPPGKRGSCGGIDRIRVLAIALIELQHVPGIGPVKIAPEIHRLTIAKSFPPGHPGPRCRSLCWWPLYIPDVRANKQYRSCGNNTIPFLRPE